ncbi:hypothetical protein EUA47_03180 [Staphylococcus saprophyticus]|uniref:hypothetical protein n=1 Tax=Staphylococcus saprophyticus TaxID=29385 RepID=UPI00101128CA|nr:hypothetical protein [Staphylococcus saprophyticus]MDW3782113.1 hypothetical protein [Staphylococcus saprophyticus]MDW3788522.1 hypothetical protein [Staphylococcus saprophyticus]MDW4034549.1 hypothetical protein [Staphylococcus saprophyticus]MDW4377904.1 hypothetical protein [Staphylococcus saprophyticus]RXS23247.1 hypothetical protein EUA47_03180 [Staphylococcus saprophyticus]
MKNIKNYLNENRIKFEDKNTGSYSPYVKFMINNIIYVITDYKNKFEICTIDRKMVIETKTQKAMVEKLQEVA